MVYIIQFGIILAVTLLGELLHSLLPLPVPASVYGLLLMLLALVTGIIKLHQVDQTATVLLEWLPLLLVPVTVGLMSRWGVLQSMLLPLLMITVVSTLLVMAVTGVVTQWMIRRNGGDDR